MSKGRLKAGLIHYRMGILAVVALAGMVGLVTIGADGGGNSGAVNHYVGVDKCKSCHVAKEKGDQYDIWKGTKHAQAYEVLASDKAKEYGKKVGIDDPQTSPKCLVCHETGYGDPKEMFDKTFVNHQGVQCETCHGPGENHVKARFAAASAPAAGGDNGGFGGGFGDDNAAPTAPTIPAGEILMPKDETTCVKCHNANSPSAKASEKFDFPSMFKKIAHPDPLLQAAAKKAGN
ncbi:MAG: multiheme c-type cytochrome [Planctomycetota bacterium]